MMLAAQSRVVLSRQKPLLPKSVAPATRSSPNRRSFSSSSSNNNNFYSSYYDSFTSWYAGMLHEQPILTKAVTSGIIAGAGDWICQYSVHRRHIKQSKQPRTLESGWQKTKEVAQDTKDVANELMRGNKPETGWWDAARTGRFVFLGSVFVGPVIHYWYGFLATQFPSTALKSVAQRVAVDQFLFAPVYLPVWLTALWTLEGDNGNNVNNALHGKDPRDVNSKLGDRLLAVTPNLLLANWLYWIPAQFCNFTYMPLPYQVLFSNVAALLWTAYLSFSANDDVLKTKRDQELVELPVV
ncbi:hypothetical protein MPSEU_001104800 [Mayamaea pseudoterrestris]|nr:hypothetical protein MPSEU_001104800 [Mayamaea pseudoterrestris]